MPALVYPDKVIAADAAESTFKQCITVVEKKVRNLEKRKAKLDSYQMKQTEGVELNKDQKDAVSKYEVVSQNLEFARELQKQFQMMLAESEKMLRKQAKREKVERQLHEAARVQSVLKLKTVLSGLLRSHVKSDFLSGSHGAVILTEQAVEQLCSFEQLICHGDDLSDLRHVEEASEHIVAYLDGKDAPVVGTTYRTIQDTVQQIIDCGYFCRPSDAIPQEANSQQEKVLPCNDEDPVTNEEQGDPASLTSDPPSPLSCKSTSSANITPSDLPPAIETFTAKLTLDESEPTESTVSTDNGQTDHCTVDSEQHYTPTEEKPNNSSLLLPFTFETADSVAVCPSKKDAREIVSAFDGHFNFLQESLIDEEWAHPSSQTVTPNSATYPVPVSAFSTSHAVFPAPVATYAANSVFPASADTFTPSFIADMTCQPAFESPVSTQEAVTYPNQYGNALMSTIPYITSPMMNEAYFAHHNVNYGHQVAYTTAFGSVVPNYNADPVLSENHVDVHSGVYQMGEEVNAVVDEAVGAGYEPTTEVYAGSSFQVVSDALVSNGDAGFSEAAALNKMESSALNPNASEFHSRFTPPLDCAPTAVDCFSGNDEDGHIESLDITDGNGDYQDLSRGNQCGFRSRGRGFRGGSRGGRYNSNRGGGYGQKYRNGYHRGGYINEYNGPTWRGYSRGGRVRGSNGMRNARGFTSNNSSNHDVTAVEESNNQQ